MLQRALAIKHRTPSIPTELKYGVEFVFHKQVKNIPQIDIDFDNEV